MNAPATIDAGIKEAIERVAQGITAELRAGTTYQGALAGAIIRSTLGPSSWVKVIARVEELRKVPFAPSEERLVAIILDVIPRDEEITWPDFTHAMAAKIASPNWLKVRMLLKRLERDGVIRADVKNAKGEVWERLR